MKPVNAEMVIRGKRYSTKTATLIASDAWWDGMNYERNGRNTFLYRTPKGAYFVLRLSLWPAEGDIIEPVSEYEAVTIYERMAAHGMAEVSFEEAFPNRPVEDA